MDTAQIQIPPKLIPVFLAPNKRYRGAFGGRGSGKTRTFAKMAAVNAYKLSQAGERGLIVCGREYMNSLEDSSMSEVKEAILSEDWLAAHFEIGDKYIRTADRRIEFAFIGLRHNLDSIKSKAKIHLLWVDEAEPVTDTAWQKAIPTIREHGSEIWVTWNPESKKSATHKRFRESTDDDMIIAELNWRDNPWFPDVLEAERQRDKRDRPEDYDHIWEGGFRKSVVGGIYAKQLAEAREEGRITRIPIEPGYPVHTFWDLGKNDHNCIWFMQEVGPQKRFIDYYENRLQDLDHYVRVMKGRATPKEMAEFGITEEENNRRAKYNPGQNYLPHDVSVKLLGMKRTRKEQLEDAGLDIEVVPRIESLNEGIEQTRAFFASCWFDELWCEEGLDALGNYRWKYSDEHDAFMKTPVHDWASNGSDAFRQAATGYMTKRKSHKIPDFPSEFA